MGAVLIGVTIYVIAGSGRPVEGLIVSVSDDGIDRVYGVYYEDGGQSFEANFTAKRKSPAGRLVQGNLLTVLVAKPAGLLPQVLILRPA